MIDVVNALINSKAPLDRSAEVFETYGGYYPALVLQVLVGCCVLSAMVYRSSPLYKPEPQPKKYRLYVEKNERVLMAFADEESSTSYEFEWEILIYVTLLVVVGWYVRNWWRVSDQFTSKLKVFSDAVKLQRASLFRILRDLNPEQFQLFNKHILLSLDFILMELISVFYLDCLSLNGGLVDRLINCGIVSPGRGILFLGKNLGFIVFIARVLYIMIVLNLCINFYKMYNMVILIVIPYLPSNELDSSGYRTLIDKYARCISNNELNIIAIKYILCKLRLNQFYLTKDDIPLFDLHSLCKSVNIAHPISKYECNDTSIHNAYALDPSLLREFPVSQDRLKGYLHSGNFVKGYVVASEDLTQYYFVPEEYAAGYEDLSRLVYGYVVPSDVVPKNIDTKHLVQVYSKQEDLTPTYFDGISKQKEFLESLGEDESEVKTIDMVTGEEISIKSQIPRKFCHLAATFDIRGRAFPQMKAIKRVTLTKNYLVFVSWRICIFNTSTSGREEILSKREDKQFHFSSKDFVHYMDLAVRENFTALYASLKFCPYLALFYMNELYSEFCSFGENSFFPHRMATVREKNPAVLRATRKKNLPTYQKFKRSTRYTRKCLVQSRLNENSTNIDEATERISQAPADELASSERIVQSNDVVEHVAVKSKETNDNLNKVETTESEAAKLVEDDFQSKEVDVGVTSHSDEFSESTVEGNQGKDTDSKAIKSILAEDVTIEELSVQSDENVNNVVLPSSVDETPDQTYLAIAPVDECKLFDSDMSSETDSFDLEPIAESQMVNDNAGSQNHKEFSNFSNGDGDSSDGNNDSSDGDGDSYEGVNNSSNGDNDSFDGDSDSYSDFEIL